MEENQSKMTPDEKKKFLENKSLIYAKQYDRKIPFYFTPATKPGFYFTLFVGYQLYVGTVSELIGFSILFFGLIFIYRNFVSTRFQETESLYIFKILIGLRDFLVREGRKKERRYISEADMKKKIGEKKLRDFEKEKLKK